MSRASNRRGKVRNEGGTVDSIHRRDKGRCWLCKHGVTLNEASRDHLMPHSADGYNKARNYRLAHRECNTARGPLPMRETLAALATVRENAPRTMVCIALRNALREYRASAASAQDR